MIDFQGRISGCFVKSTDFRGDDITSLGLVKSSTDCQRQCQRNDQVGLGTILNISDENYVQIAC